MARGVAEVLGEIRGGFALRDAAEKLEDLVKAVKATGKSGSLTIKLKVEPDKSDDRIVTMTPDIDVKTPKRPYSPGIFFMDDNGKLTRDDPKQAQLFEERERQGVATLNRPASTDPNVEAAQERQDEANITRLGLGKQSV